MESTSTRLAIKRIEQQIAVYQINNRSTGMRVTCPIIKFWPRSSFVLQNVPVTDTKRR